MHTFIVSFIPKLSGEGIGEEICLMMGIERRVIRASKIMIVAALQKITMPSVIDVIGLKKFLLLSMEDSCPSLSTNKFYEQIALW